jgi:hypothetical protein
MDEDSAERRARALEQRIHRIAADLAHDTGKPLEFWLVEVAKITTMGGSWRLLHTPEGPRLVVDVVRPDASG